MACFMIRTRATDPVSVAVNAVSQWVNQVYKSYVSSDQLGATSLSILRLFNCLGKGRRRLDGNGEEGGSYLKDRI